MTSRGLWSTMSAGTRRSLTLAWTVLFVLSLLMQAGALSSPPDALAVHDDGIFELDGNALDEATAGDDWQNGTPGAAASLFIPGSVEKDGVDTTYFAQGGSKDHHDIDEWHYSATDVAPDKDELIDVFAAAYDTAEGTAVYFGADKFDDSGDAQIGFWFFQGAVSLGANGLFNGVHTVGDVLVLSDFTNGGAVDLICVYEWNPPGDDIADGVPVDTGCDTGDNLTLAAAGAECDVSGPDGEFDVCAVVNAGTETAPWPFVNKDGATSFGAGQFFEGGINLDELFGGDAPCFSGFLAETRSSQEVEAQLKDFALGTLNTCEPPEIETQVSDSIIDMGESVTDTADLTGNDPLPTGTITFHLCGPAASAFPDCSTGGTIISTETLVNGLATSDPFTADSGADIGYYCFRAEYTPDANGELNYEAGAHTNLTSECFRVIPADVQIVKTPNSGTVSAGTDISFTLSWTNEGEGGASGVVVTDTLPTGGGLNWSISGSTGTGSVCTLNAADVLTCNIGTIAGNPNFPNPAPVNGTVTLTSATTAASCAVINNTGQITSANDGTDTDPGQITVLCAVIDIEKDANPEGPVNAGDTIGFDIVVSNNGDGTANDVSVTDNLPAGVDWSINPDVAGCSISGAVGAEVLTCTRATLAGGASFTVHVEGVTDAADCGTVNNTAIVTTSNDGGDSDGASVDILCPDVQALKVADASPVNAGDQIGFTVTIKNNGPGTAYGATGSDTLPGGIDWTIDGPANGWSINAGVLSFGPADLAAGASASVHIVGTTDPADCGNVPNTVTVDATNESNDPSITDDNAASDDVDVLCGQINVEKVADDDEVVAGNQIGFTVTLTNSGEGNITGLSFSDDLPGGPGINWTIESGDAGWSITGTAPNQQLAYAPTTLAAGTSSTVHVVSDTTADSCGVYDNTATVDSANDGSDEASDSTSVRCPVLTILKDVSGNTGGTAINGLPIAKIGDTLTFTLTYDITSPPANNGIITDPIPAGLEYVTDSATTNAEFDEVSYDPATRTLTWLADVVSVDGSVSFKVTVLETAPDLAQPITNVATIDSDDTDEDDDDASVLVQEVQDVTNPPTSTIDNPKQTPSNPGFSLMLILLALAAFALSLGYFTPVPERARRRTEGRRR